jgi:hypothetical protein
VKVAVQLPLRLACLGVGWGVDMGSEGGVQPSLARDEFRERLRRVCEAQEFHRGYATQVRGAALTAWAAVAVGSGGLCLALLLISSAASPPPTAHDLEVAASLHRGIGGVPCAPPPALLEANARWFELNGGRLGR